MDEENVFRSINNIYLNGVRIAALNEQGTAAYYLTDQVDSVSHVLDDQGKTLTRIQNDPYGDSFVQRGNLNFSPKFNSQELDQESGFYFYNARYYDASIARFLTADSIIDGAEDTQGWNRYLYVRGNPINAKDPTGHEAVDYKAKQAKMSKDTQINVIGRKDARVFSINPPDPEPGVWDKLGAFGKGILEGLWGSFLALQVIIASGPAAPLVGIGFFLAGVWSTADAYDIVANGRIRHEDDDGYSGVSTLTRWRTAGGTLGGFLMIGRGHSFSKHDYRGNWGLILVRQKLLDLTMEVTEVLLKGFQRFRKLLSCVLGQKTKDMNF
ncbi:RHS repeat-associated core domain-containing protein [Leptospira wolffii]|uniref:RHS repeat-associated core domain-containing protein n=1 Tax=Leptospira wolffii TaxID=409998 RepID=A0ABV5BST4_9LEPT